MCKTLEQLQTSCKIGIHLYLVEIIGLGTADNEPSEVSQDLKARVEGVLNGTVKVHITCAHRYYLCIMRFLIVLPNSGRRCAVAREVLSHCLTSFGLRFLRPKRSVIRNAAGSTCVCAGNGPICKFARSPCTVP